MNKDIYYIYKAVQEVGQINQVYEHDMMSETKGGPNPNVGVLLEQKLLKQNHAEPVGKQRCVAETAST